MADVADLGLSAVLAAVPVQDIAQGFSVIEAMGESRLIIATGSRCILARLALGCTSRPPDWNY